MPITPFIGVRISWLMVARKALLAALAASAAARASRRRCAAPLLARARSTRPTIKASSSNAWAKVCHWLPAVKSPGSTGRNEDTAAARAHGHQVTMLIAATSKTARSTRPPRRQPRHAPVIRIGHSTSQHAPEMLKPSCTAPNSCGSPARATSAAPPSSTRWARGARSARRISVAKASAWRLATTCWNGAQTTPAAPNHGVRLAARLKRSHCSPAIATKNAAKMNCPRSRVSMPSSAAAAATARLSTATERCKARYSRSA